jgi:hypothetical protein
MTVGSLASWTTQFGFEDDDMVAARLGGMREHAAELTTTKNPKPTARIDLPHLLLLNLLLGPEPFAGSGDWQNEPATRGARPISPGNSRLAGQDIV